MNETEWVAGLNYNYAADMYGEIIFRDIFDKTLKLMKTCKAAGIGDMAMDLFQNASTDVWEELI